MASAQSTAGASGPPSPVPRVSPQSSLAARVTADAPRRSSPVERSLSPSSRQEGGRSGEGDATNGRARSRGPNRNDNQDDDGLSEEDGDNYDSGMSARNGTPTLSDEFVLTSFPLDTWVGRYVRITTPRHNGQTGKVHRTGNGWVNLQTAGGEVAKRAYNLIVIPESLANITPGGLDDKGESASRAKRYRGPKDPLGMESASASGDERKSSARGRNSRAPAPTAHSSSDSSGQDDDNEDEGDEHNNGRPARRRGRAPVGGSDYDEADDADEDEDDDGDRYDDDGRMRGPARGKPFFPSKHSRAMMKSVHGGDGAGDRFGGGESGKDGGKSSGKISSKYAGPDKGRARAKGDQEKMRDRGRGCGDQSRGGKGDSYMPSGKAKGGDPDAGGPRAKRKDPSSSLNPPCDSDEKMVPGTTNRERVDRSKDKPGAPGPKKEEGMKNSWLSQIAKAKDRPNLVRWREELLPTTKDSSEDFEDATLSVELMKARCDVCYHEKADGDKFCWNDECWRSPVFFGYFKSDPFGSDSGNGGGRIEPPATQRKEEMNFFAKETVIDPALTSALQAPVKWLETKRKRNLETHEVFSEDPALYRWQCWASNFPDPNSKDPTYVDESRMPDVKRAKSGRPRNMAGPKLSPERNRTGNRECDDDDGPRMHVNGDGHDEVERSVKCEMGRVNKSGARGDSPGPEAMNVFESMQRQGGSGHPRRGWN